MNPLTICVSALLILATSTVAARGSDHPTTAPGESPKSALKGYNAAMRAGDVDALVELQHAVTDVEKRVARAVARSEAHVGRLLVATRETFGPEGATRVGKALHDVSDADIDASTETITGDRATLRFPAGGSAVLVQVDGEWKSSVADLVRGFGGDPDEAIATIARRGNFAKVMAQDIGAGKYKSVDAAVERIERHERGTHDDEPAN
jgi:hypothetical protein